MTSTMKTTPKMETCNIEGCIVNYLKKMTTPQFASGDTGSDGIIAGL